MNRKLIVFVIVIFLFQPLGMLYACTSFAVYSNQVYYGMNFDYMNLPMKFRILTNGDIRTFHLAFERTVGGNRFFVNTAGMNSNGLFSSCQELHPVNANPNQKTDENIYTFELYEAISFSRSVKEIEKIARNLPLVDIPGITLHNLFADTNGRAIVTEAGGDVTKIVEMKKNFMVMTNFSLGSLVGKSYTQAIGAGDERYIICHEFLKQHASDFNIEKGFELLSLCRNKDPKYSTMCSMVFDPQEGDVYIALERNFSQLLKLTIENGNIETFRGYEKHTMLPAAAEADGLLIEDLKQKLL